MSIRRLTGSRIREKRLDQNLKQAAVAEAVGISPSYLNLIEHNRRRIGGKLLNDLATVLGVDTGRLTEGADSELLDQMHVAAVKFGNGVEVARTEEIAARYPGWSALIAAQAKQLTSMEEHMQVLNDRMNSDPHLAASLHEVISAVTAIRSAASILVGQEDLDADWQRRFHENIDKDSRRLASSSEALITYLEAPKTEGHTTARPHEDVEAFFAARDYHVPALEAKEVDLSAFVASANLPGSASRLLAHQAGQYHADATRLPYAAFAAASREVTYDPMRLAQMFSVDFACVLRRLSTLSITEGHPPFGLAVCDASGTLRFLKTVPGFTIPRLGGACPLWPMFGAFSRPGQPVREDVVLPGSVPIQLRCYAIADPVGLLRFDGPPALQSTMLVLPEPDVLADAPTPVGVTCRICSRSECASRREFPIQGVPTHSRL